MEKRRIMLVYRFEGGTIIVLDHENEEILDLQGYDTPELRRKINARVDEDTKFKNYKVELWKKE